MNLKEIRETYYEATGKTSELTRNLGFAGIALIWVFKAGTDGNQVIPRALLTPAIFIVISLALDLCQYASRSIIWGVYNRIKERKETPEKANFEVPPSLNWIPLGFFWGKIICIMIAYIFLIIFLYSRFV